MPLSQKPWVLQGQNTTKITHQPQSRRATMAVTADVFLEQGKALYVHFLTMRIIALIRKLTLKEINLLKLSSW